MSACKILPVAPYDVDGYGDFLNDDKAREFIAGGYTHVVCDGVVCEAETYESPDGPTLVCIGQQISVESVVQIR